MAKQKSSGWLDKYQEGGGIPQAQNGLWQTNKKGFVDSVLNANKNLDFVQRLYDGKYGSIQVPGISGRSTHLLSNDPDSRRVYPEVVNIKGQLKHLEGDDAWNYADDKKEFIEFPTAEQSSWFANSKDNKSGYKMGTNVLRAISPKTGKPFVPKHENGGWLEKYKEGGIIKDDRGQWDHPGEITEIGSNQITMQGVPYAVLGVSDTGDTQMMYPNQEYKYKGKSVTEIPMMQNGNKEIKQKGGWLNKYK